MKEPILNDDLPSRILYGAIKVKSKVKEITETSAIFEDGTVEEGIDVIVFATGYTFSFPFLEDPLVKVEDNMVLLYKYMFPPQLEKSTLACIGLIQPLGSIFPTVELQARWVTRVFKGKWTSKWMAESFIPGKFHSIVSLEKQDTNKKIANLSCSHESDILKS